MRSTGNAGSLARGVGLCLVVLSAALSVASCTRNPNRPGDGLFGERCDEDKDCKSLICAGLDGEAKLCTETCSDPLGDECNTGFRCRRPDRETGLVCVCTDPRGCERRHPEPGGDCTVNSDCDDEVECTEDRCESEECTHVVDPNVCGSGSSCDANLGCVENEPCSDASDCELAGDPCRQLARCDFSTGRCHYDLTDNDGDGHFALECGGDDCDDFNAGAAAGLFDDCDSIDNDCDGFFDEDARACGGMGCSFGQCACDLGLTDCTDFGSGCADINSDPFNCGGCGIVCGDGFTCSNRQCLDVDECALGTICPPNSTCANTFGGLECRCNRGFEPNASSTECIDVDECSRGLHTCTTASNCTNLFGSFQCRCPAGLEDFGFGCVDINECANGFDCGHGFCQNLVGSFQCSCNAGYAPHPTAKVCQLVDECRAGELADFSWCDGACRDLRSDASYCGSCFNRCYGDAFCQNRRCRCDDPSLTYCNGSCIDTDSDRAHCGSCYHECPRGAECVDGGCVCPSGQVPCGSQCVALGTMQNCRGCGDACPLGGTCGAAGCACPASARLACDGLCVNPDIDVQHCGSCYNWCPEDAACDGGECQCPTEAPDFCAEWGACYDFESSEESCGSCGNWCDVICNEGACSFTEQIALGGGMGCVRFTDGRLGCFGSNENGRLGRGLNASLASEPLGLLPLSHVTAVAARSAHACAADASGKLWCWGKNQAQQLGNDITTDQASPVQSRDNVEDVAVGAAHTCVVLRGSGKVECVGSDALGQRGDGAASPALGTWSGPSTLERVSQLVSGDNHLCALVDGDVFCWGDNASGQLGNGASGAGSTQDAPGAKVAGLGEVAQIAAGQSHTCALAAGQVYCWGENSSSQCGTSDTSDRVTPNAVTGVSSAIAIAAGDAHTCALLSDHRIVCWGSGAQRQNGRTTTGPELRLIDGYWLSVAAGSVHTCATIENADFGCWGDGPSITYPVDTATPVRIPR